MTLIEAIAYSQSNDGAKFAAIWKYATKDISPYRVINGDLIQCNERGCYKMGALGICRLMELDLTNWEILTPNNNGGKNG